MKVDMVTVEERDLTWARGDNEARFRTETSLQRKGGRPGCLFFLLSHRNLPRQCVSTMDLGVKTTSCEP